MEVDEPPLEPILPTTSQSSPLHLSRSAQTRSLVLVGFMASGKSTIGPVLAELLQLPFSDSDSDIEQQFGMDVAQIFKLHGERAFRAAERETMREMTSGERRVVAAGGGAFSDPSTRDLLAMRAVTIWIDPPFELIRTRLEHCTARPLARTADVRTLRDLWEERRLAYAQADLHVVITGEEPGQIARLIAQRLGIT